MEKLFQVNIITPERSLLKEGVVSLIVPAESGYLGVLANHAPIIANLVPGKIIFRDKSGGLNIIHSKAKGFLEVLNNKVTLLLDYLEGS